ncbi:MAG: DUF3048 domain-containing protein [Bacillus sp. (in: Bacteria)]|nr:DUF3048 domain-containing protein [Bacillus sp. (in: firmicutes)]
MITRSKILIIVLIIFVLSLVACKQEEQAADELGEQQAVELEHEPEPKPDPELEPEIGTTYPLTGLEAPDDLEEYRAFGVMIENSVHARPQSGLFMADLVYEVLSEGSITRLLAFYHSQQPDLIGPIRSARSYYVHLNKGYDAVYVAAGGSPGGLQLAQSDYVDNISGLAYDGRYFSRSATRQAPHNMYTSYQDLLAAAEHRGIDMSGAPPELYFEDELIDGERDEALKLEIKYGSSTNNVQYEYDDALNRYIRFNGGQRIEDLETGDPITPRNIFIVEASHRVIPKGENHIDAGSQRREIDTESGGRGLLIQDGFIQQVNWKNENGLILPYKDDKLLPFLRGQTWIHFVPSANGGIDSYVEVIE